MKKVSWRTYGTFAVSSCLLFTAAYAVPAVAATGSAASNLIGAYEDADNNSVPDGWSLYAKGNNCKLSVGPTSVFATKDTLLVDVTQTDKNPIIMHKTIKLDDAQKDKKYSFSEFVATDDLTGGSAFCRYMLVDASNKAITGATEVLPKMSGTTAAKLLTAEIDIPKTLKGKEVAGIKIENYVSGNTLGKVYFSEPSLVKKGSLAPVSKPLGPLANADFEQAQSTGLPMGWGKWQSGSSPFECQIDPSEKHDGSSSVHIFNGNASKAARGTLNQTIVPVPADWQHKTIKVSQWVKTKDFDPQKLSLRLQWKDSNGKKIEPYPSLPIKVAQNQDWTQYDFLIDFPAQQVNSIVFEYLYDSCKGSVWVDDVSISAYNKLIDFAVTPDLVTLAPQEKKALNVSFIPADASNKTLNFSSSDTSICAVSNTGEIIGVKEGIATIKVSSDEVGTVREVCVCVGSKGIKTQTVNRLSTPEDQTLFASLSSQELDGYKEISLATKPAHGSVDLLDKGAFKYYPETGFYGTDGFIAELTNNDGSKVLYKVTIDVIHTNPAPVFADFKILVNQDSKDNTEKLSGYDVEGEQVTFSIKSAPIHGTMSIVNGSYVYTPEAGYNGYDSCDFVAEDTSGKHTVAHAKIYVAPSTAVIKAQIKDVHPYMLVANKDDFARMKLSVAQDPLTQKMFVALQAKADGICATAPVPFALPDGLRMDTKASKNTVDLAFMYRMTGDKKYFDRCWDELHSLCSAYPSWNASKHFLDSNMTAFGVACAYDWLYDELTPAQRQEAEDALVKNCIDPGLDFFRNNSHFFVNDGYNWNFVCNTGITSASLAIMGGAHDAKALEALQYSWKSIQNGLGQYAPEGDSIEGVSYWDYGTRYLVYFLSSVSSATKVANPFLASPGIAETPDYPIAMSGKAGEFNYSDNDCDLLPAGYLSLWFANELNRPDLTWYHKFYMDSPSAVVNVYDLLWYNPSNYGGSAPKQLDWAFKDRQPVVTMRSDYGSSEEGAFLGFKGGLNGAPHGDLDAGSFVFDALGTRWASDLGKGNYNLPGYWEKQPGGERWKYYRKRAEGHNTLIINPGTGYDQEVGPLSKFTALRLDNTTSPYAIADLTDVYGSKAFSIKRGMRFVGRKALLCRDEFNLKEAGVVAWQMHTQAHIDIVDGGKKAILTDNNRRLEVKLLESGLDASAKFKVLPAKSYTYPLFPGEKDNTGFTKLVVDVAGKQGSITILMTPYLDCEKSTDVVPEVQPLDLWKGSLEKGDEQFVKSLSNQGGSDDQTQDQGQTSNPGTDQTTTTQTDSSDSSSGSATSGLSTSGVTSSKGGTSSKGSGSKSQGSVTKPASGQKTTEKTADQATKQAAQDEQTTSQQTTAQNEAGNKQEKPAVALDEKSQPSGISTMGIIGFVVAALACVGAILALVFARRHHNDEQ